MAKEPGKYAKVWINIKYLAYTLATLAVIIPLLLSLWWLIQIVTVCLIGAVIFVVYKILGAPVPDKDP